MGVPSVRKILNSSSISCAPQARSSSEVRARAAAQLEGLQYLQGALGLVMSACLRPLLLMFHSIA